MSSWRWSASSRREKQSCDWNRHMIEERIGEILDLSRSPR
jgi:hypothetical protein